MQQAEAPCLERWKKIKEHSWLSHICWAIFVQQRKSWVIEAWKIWLQLSRLAIMLNQIVIRAPKSGHLCCRSCSPQDHYPSETRRLNHGKDCGCSRRNQSCKDCKTYVPCCSHGHPAQEWTIWLSTQSAPDSSLTYCGLQTAFAR